MSVENNRFFVTDFGGGNPRWLPSGTGLTDLQANCLERIMRCLPNQSWYENVIVQLQAAFVALGQEPPWANDLVNSTFKATLDQYVGIWDLQD